MLSLTLSRPSECGLVSVAGRWIQRFWMTRWPARTINQLIAAVRRFGREVPQGRDLLATHATGYDYSGTGKPDIAWDDAQAKDDLISALVTGALALLESVDPQRWEPGTVAYQAHVLLTLVAGQDVEPAEGSDGTDGRWKIAWKVAADRVISTADSEARHAVRRARIRWLERVFSLREEESLEQCCSYGLDSDHTLLAHVELFACTARRNRILGCAS